MYASYWYNANSLASNILSDLVAILTGETTVNNLSSDCNKTYTNITASATTAGWSVHDSSAGTNMQCLKAICNNSTLYKYMVLSTNTAGYLMQNLYASWDSTAHSGTNVAYHSNLTTSSQSLDLTNGGRIEIYANVRCCMFWGKPLKGIWGEGSYNGPTGIFERTRSSWWDTDTNGYIPVVYIGNFYGQYINECIYPRETGIEVTGSGANLYIEVFGGGSNIPVLPTEGLKNLFGREAVYPLYPIRVNRLSYGHIGGCISTLCDIWMTVSTVLGAFDKIIHNSHEYIIWTSAIWRILIRKG